MLFVGGNCRLKRLADQVGGSVKGRVSGCPKERKVSGGFATKERDLVLERDLSRVVQRRGARDGKSCSPGKRGKSREGKEKEEGEILLAAARIRKWKRV